MSHTTHLGLTAVFVTASLSTAGWAQDGAVAPPVVGGSEVSEGDWSDAAAVWTGREVSCTGVLIAPDVVLTAGHCVRGITAVTVGTNDFEEGGTKIDVEEVVAYPSWHRTYDLAVLLLEEEAPVEPRQIAQGCVLDELTNGADVIVVGYGAINPRGTEYTSHLMEGITTVDDFDCTDMDAGCMPAVSPEGELGAGEHDDVDSCYGDSGGPLYLPTDHGDYLVGITSRGYDFARTCGEGGIYVRPDAVIDWIEEVADITLPPPDCGAAPDESEGEGTPDTQDGTEDGGKLDLTPVGDQRTRACGCASAAPSTAMLAFFPALVALIARRRFS